MWEYVDRAVAFAIAEDLVDIEVMNSRRKEPTESLDTFLTELKKDLTTILAKGVVRIIKRISELSPNPYRVDATKLRGREEWRICQGNRRIHYDVNEQIITVIVVKVGQRRYIYRKTPLLSPFFAGSHPAKGF